MVCMGHNFNSFTLQFNAFLLNPTETRILIFRTVSVNEILISCV